MVSYRKDYNHEFHPTKIRSDHKKFRRKNKRERRHFPFQNDNIFSDISNIFKRVERGIITKFGYFRIEEVNSFIKDIKNLIRLVKSKISYDDENFLDVTYEYVKKSLSHDNYIPSPFYRTIEDNEKQVPNISIAFHKHQSMMKRIQNSIQLKKTPSEEDVYKNLQLLSELFPSMNEHFPISRKEKKLLRRLLKRKTWKSLTLGNDSKQHLQYLTTNYEMLRYLCGYIQALFDLNFNKLNKNIKKSYFNLKFNVYQEFYSSNGLRWSKISKNLRLHINSLNKQWLGLKRVFDKVFTDIREYRTFQCHRMGEIRQNKLDKKLLAVQDKSGRVKYIKIKEIFWIQNDLFLLNRIATWVSITEPLILSFK